VIVYFYQFFDLIHTVVIIVDIIDIADVVVVHACWIVCREGGVVIIQLML